MRKPEKENMKRAKKVLALTTIKPAKAIVPPPKKREIIEALVLAERAEYIKKYNERKERLDRLENEVIAETIKAITSNPKIITDHLNRETIMLRMDGIRVDVYLNLSAIGDKGAKAKQEFDRINKEERPFWDAGHSRKRMTLAINCDPARVKALSETKEIAETLAHIHAHIVNGEVKKAITIN